MQIHLFRHGETDWNKAERFQGKNSSRLTRLGVRQAKNLGRKMTSVKFDRIYCSPSLRTRQTASHIWPDLTEEIIYLDSLMEINLGPLEGKLYTEVLAEDSEAHDNFFYRPHLFRVEGAETFKDLATRAENSLDEMCHTLGDQKIAVVSHGAFIKTLLTSIAGKDLSKVWDPPYLDNCGHSIIEKSLEGFFKIRLCADAIVNE